MLSGLNHLTLAVSLLAIAAWFELFDGLQSIAMGAIRGLNDGRTTLLIGLTGYWCVGAPLAWLLAFPLGWGAQGVWQVLDEDRAEFAGVRAQLQGL